MVVESTPATPMVQLTAATMRSRRNVAIVAVDLKTMHQQHLQRRRCRRQHLHPPRSHQLYRQHHLPPHLQPQLPLQCQHNHLHQLRRQPRLCLRVAPHALQVVRSVMCLHGASLASRQMTLRRAREPTEENGAAVPLCQGPRLLPLQGPHLLPQEVRIVLVTQRSMPSWPVPTLSM